MLTHSEIGCPAPAEIKSDESEAKVEAITDTNTNTDPVIAEPEPEIATRESIVEESSAQTKPETGGNVPPKMYCFTREVWSEEKKKFCCDTYRKLHIH